MIALGLGLGVSFGTPTAATTFIGPLDAYFGNNWDALSLNRRLLSNYSGPLFQVMRSSDSVTLDIGFLAASPCIVDKSSLTSFVGPSDGLITKVYNQNTNASDFVSVNGHRPKIISGGVLQTFNGSYICMVTTVAGQEYLVSASNNPLPNDSSYAAVLQSAGATWGSYGSPYDRSDAVFGGYGILDSGATDWYSGVLPIAVRRNGVNLSSPFSMAPINSPMVLGVDTNNPTTIPTGMGIAQVGLSYFQSLQWCEMVSWQIQDPGNYPFEANQKLFYSI